ncbi:expressed unknown protein [Seminavis robusta]|uniref:C2H2-type domain-containing protein n=1 Tax=Seminavis robusta TaxID=568900 RepID=A0A9N8H7A5_9STRA|nr:expressed unknown protein [Seminavis robusta]|eukprot:Sro172_g076070.1 n/a (445) ;mRNA; r:78498-79832
MTETNDADNDHIGWRAAAVAGTQPDGMSKNAFKKLLKAKAKEENNATRKKPTNHYCGVCSRRFITWQGLGQHMMARPTWCDGALSRAEFVPIEPVPTAPYQDEAGGYGIASNTSKANEPREAGTSSRTRVSVRKPTARTNTSTKVSVASSVSTGRLRTITEEKKTFPCNLCDRKFSSWQERDSHTMVHPEHLRQVYAKEGLALDNGAALELWCQMAACSSKGDDDVDYTAVEDAARMLQDKHDDAVVAVALHNYETFFGMEDGTATYAQVNGTSAGIDGWASSAINNVSIDNQQNDNDEGKSKPADHVTAKEDHRGDTEESRMLKRAMMESLLEAQGVRVPERLVDNCRDSEDEEGFYYYEGSFYDSESDNGSDDCSDDLDDDSDGARSVDAESFTIQHDSSSGSSDESWSRVSDGWSREEGASVNGSRCSGWSIVEGDPLEED